MSTNTRTVPVGQPLPGASFGQSVSRFLRGYVRFSGRASRSEFWWAMLFVWLLSMAAVVPAMVLAGTMSGWSEPGGAALLTPEEAQATVWTYFALIGAALLISLLTTIPTFAVMWRRVQDANFHGAWILLSFVGLSIVPFIMCFLPSNPAGARFGPATPQQAAFGFAPGGYATDSPAAMRERTFGAPARSGARHAGPMQPAPAPRIGSAQPSGPSSGGLSYGGLSYGGQPYGSPPSGSGEQR